MGDTRARVVDLQPRSDEGGWEWTVESDGRSRRYRSDRRYQGLWVWVEDGPSAEWRQTYGDLQVEWPTGRAAMIRRLGQPFRGEPGYDVSALA